MEFRYVDIFFRYIAFLFAVSFHEAAHAWTADQCGDDTARHLGRVSLNPIRHIDPVGTLALPLIGMFSGLPYFGWGKPCPVNPLRLRDKIKSDILVSLAGPISNAILVCSTMILLIVVVSLVPDGKDILYGVLSQNPMHSSSAWMPVVWLLYQCLLVNIMLGLFNLIPVPPLDGSHVLTHLLPEPIKTWYSNFGIAGLVLLVLFGQPLLRAIIVPVLRYFQGILVDLIRG